MLTGYLADMTGSTVSLSSHQVLCWSNLALTICTCFAASVRISLRALQEHSKVSSHVGTPSVIVQMAFMLSPPVSYHTVESSCSERSTKVQSPMKTRNARYTSTISLSHSGFACWFDCWVGKVRGENHMLPSPYCVIPSHRQGVWDGDIAKCENVRMGQLNACFVSWLNGLTCKPSLPMFMWNVTCWPIGGLVILTCYTSLIMYFLLGGSLTTMLIKYDIFLCHAILYDRVYPYHRSGTVHDLGYIH